MGFLDELKRLAHPYEDEPDDDDYDDYDDQPDPIPEPKKERSREAREPQGFQDFDRRSSKVVNIHTTTQLQVVLVKPMRYSESASEIADHLRYKRTVVLNLEDTKADEARRLLDFLTGAAYAYEGQIKKVALATFIITPYNVDIQGDLLDELENNGLFF